MKCITTNDTPFSNEKRHRGGKKKNDEGQFNGANCRYVLIRLFDKFPKNEYFR